MQITVENHIGTDCVTKQEVDTGQLAIRADGQLIGFVGQKDGDGIRLHGHSFTPDQLKEIEAGVRKERPDQNIRGIGQAPPPVQPRKTATENME